MDCCQMLITFIPLAVLLGGSVLLHWKEREKVQTAKSLNEGLQSVNALPSTDVVADSYNNKLVHLSGHLKTDMPLTDPEYGINLHVVHLKRDVEMYQRIKIPFRESEHKEGHGTRKKPSYSYFKIWSSVVIPIFENGENHENPSSLPIREYTKTAKEVYLGLFRLSEGLVDKISSKYQKLKLTQIPKINKDLKLMDGYFYHSENAVQPKVGDVRVSFHFAGVSESDHEEIVGPPTKVSVVARQNGTFLTAYQTSAGDQLELLYFGNMSAKEIFDAEHTTNTMITWMNLVGWVLFIIGFIMTYNLFRQIVPFLPFVCTLVLATGLLSFTLAHSLAWIFDLVGYSTGLYWVWSFY